MKPPMKVTLRMLCLFVLVGLEAAPASGQAAALRSYPELDRMHDEAVAGVVTSTSTPTHREDLREAAMRHARVAAQRPEDDLRRFDCLLLQAQIVYGLADFERARRYMESAADQARATGFVFEAAKTYAKAAILARRSGASTSVVRGLTNRAELLSDSPELSRSERAWIWTIIVNAGL